MTESLRRILARWTLPVLAVAAMSALGQAQPGAQRVIKGEQVRLREAPALDARVLTQLSLSEKVELLQVEPKWVKVKTAKGSVGWVFRDFVGRGKAEGEDLRFIKGEGVRLREEPGTDSSILDELSADTRVRLLGVEGAWVRVRTSEGREGWVSRDFAGTGPTQAARSARYAARREKLILASRSKIGVRYSWGGSSDRGYDCSGFVMAMYRKLGIGLPHSSAEQFHVGKPVAKDDLQQGDLVFFSTYRRGPSHVGIYIGEGKFIHASSSRRGRGVKISSLDEAYYARRYIGARRILE